MSKAQDIQGMYPDRLLCGSVALMLAGIINKRQSHDLDFVSTEPPSDKTLASGMDYAVDATHSYVHYFCKFPHEHCLFVLQEVSSGGVFQGVEIQDPDDIVFWKRKFGRPKDIEDLKNCEVIV